MEKSNFAFAFYLVFGLVLTIIGLLLACYCGAHTNLIEPLVSALACTFGGALLRDVYYKK